jgi:hypothetical protein
MSGIPEEELIKTVMVHRHAIILATKDNGGDLKTKIEAVIFIICKMIFRG